MNESKITVQSVPDRPGVSAAIFEPLAATLIDVLVSAEDTSPTTTIAAPQQKRLGVFPPDDPACR